MKNLLTTLTLILAFAMPAGANWSKTITGTLDDCGALSMTGRRVCYFNMAAEVSTDSALLTKGQCGSVTIEFNSDLTATTVDAEGNIRACADATTQDTSICNPIYSDSGAVTMNGDCATGRCAIYGITSNYLWFDVTNATASGNTARVTATCNP